MKQKFFGEVKGHFNLRKPNGEKPTAIFFVVWLDGRQYKLSCGVKVYPKMWDKQSQKAIESNILSKADNRNNRTVNLQINRINCYFSEFKDYLCKLEEDTIDFGELLKSFIYRDMKKKNSAPTKTVDVERIISNAFDYYYTNISKAKKSSLGQYETRLKLFITYIKEKNLNNCIEVFSQGGFNSFKAYLVKKVDSDEKFGIKRMNETLELIARLINNVLAVEDEYLDLEIGTVKLVKMKDNRTQEDICRFPLYDDEIKSIIDCSVLSDKEKEYRTILVIQCECGLRVSDIKKLLIGDYDKTDSMITVLTTKEDNKGLYAQVRITPTLSHYLFEDVPNFQHINIQKFDEAEYNKTIKVICQKSGLNRIIKWKDSKGRKQQNKVYEVIVNHCFRHTFITNKVKEGVPFDVLCQMTGHADDRMIKEVYANLTKEDKRDKVSQYFDNLEQSKAENKHIDETLSEKDKNILAISRTKSILANSGLLFSDEGKYDEATLLVLYKIDKIFSINDTKFAFHHIGETGNSRSLNYRIKNAIKRIEENAVNPSLEIQKDMFCYEANEVSVSSIFKELVFMWRALQFDDSVIQRYIERAKQMKLVGIETVG